MNEMIKPYFREELLEEACNLYGLDVTAVELIRANSNLVYDAGDKILRLSHSDIRNYQDITLELEWISFLQNKQLPLAGIIHSKNDLLAEKLGGNKHFSIVCFEKIQGDKITKENWNEVHFKKLGTLLGKLHQAEREHGLAQRHKYQHWDKIPEFENYHVLSSIDENYLKIHDDVVQRFRSYAITEENYGVIHNDIHHGNYLLAKEDKKIVLFDFEMVCQSWYACDVASVVYYAKHFPTVREEEGFEDRFLQSFWQTYEQEYQLDSSEKEKIPAFLLYRDLLVLAFVRKIWDFDQLAPNQEIYVDMLRRSIARRKEILY